MRKLFFLLIIATSVMAIFTTCKRMDLNKAIDPTKIVNDVVFAVKDKDNLNGYVTSIYLNNSHAIIGGKRLPFFFHIKEKSELYTDNSDIEFTSNNAIFYFDSDTMHLSGNSIKIPVKKTIVDTLFIRPVYTKDNQGLQFTLNIKLYHFSNPTTAYYNQDFTFTMDTASLSIVPIGRILGGSVFAGKPNTKIVDTFLFEVNNYITVGGRQTPVSMTDGHYHISSSDYKTAVSFPLRDIFKDIDSSIYKDTLHGIYSQTTKLKIPFKGLTAGKNSMLSLNFTSDENKTLYTWNYNVMNIPYVLRYQDCRGTALANPALPWYAGSEFSSYLIGNEFYPMEDHYMALNFTDILEEDQYKAFNVSFRSSAPLDVYYSGGGSDVVGNDNLIYNFQNTNTPASVPVSFSYNALTPDIRYFKVVYRTDQPVDLYIIQDCQGSRVIDTLHLHPVQSTPTIVRNLATQVGYANTNKAEGGAYTYVGTITINDPNTHIGYFANMAFTKLLDNPTGYTNISGKTFFVVDPATNNKISMSTNSSNNYFLMKTNIPYQIYFMRNEFFYSKGGYNLHNNFYRNYDNKLIPMDTAFNIVDDRINATLAQVNDKDNNVDNIAYTVYNNNLQFATSGNGVGGAVPDAFNFQYKDVNTLTYNLYIDLAIDPISNPAGYTLDKFNLTYWNGGTSNNNINGKFSYFRSGTTVNPVNSSVENRADVYMNCFQLVIGDGGNEAQGIPSKIVDITNYGGNNGNIQLAASTLGVDLYNYFMRQITIINNKYADKTHKYYKIPVKLQVKIPSYYLADRKIDSLKFTLRNSEIPNNIMVGGVSLSFPAVREFAIGNITYNVKKQDMVGMNAKFWNYTPTATDYNADGSLKYIPKNIVKNASGNFVDGVWSYDKNEVDNAIAYDLQIRTGKDIGSGGVVDIDKLANLFMDVTDGNTAYAGSNTEFVFGADKNKHLSTSGNGYIKDYSSGAVDITPDPYNVGSGRFQYRGGIGGWRVTPDPLGDTTRRLYSCRIFISPNQFSTKLFDRLLTNLSLSINADNFINRGLTATEMANGNVLSSETKVVDVTNMYVKHKALEPNGVPFVILKDITGVKSLTNNSDNFVKFNIALNTPVAQNSSDFNNLYIAYIQNATTGTSYTHLDPTNLTKHMYISAYDVHFKGTTLIDDNTKDKLGNPLPLIYQTGADQWANCTGGGGDNCGTGIYRWTALERVYFGYVYKVTLPDQTFNVWIVEKKGSNYHEVENTRKNSTITGDTRYMNLKDVGGNRVFPASGYKGVNTYCIEGLSKNGKCPNHSDWYGINVANANKQYYASYNLTGSTITEKVYTCIRYDSVWYTGYNADGTGIKASGPNDTAIIERTVVCVPDDKGTDVPTNIVHGTGLDYSHNNTMTDFLNAPINKPAQAGFVNQNPYQTTDNSFIIAPPNKSVW